MDTIVTIRQKLDEIYKITGLPVSTITKEDNFRMLHPAAAINQYNVEHATYVNKMMKTMNLPYGIPLIRHLFLSTYYAIIPISEGIFVQMGPAAKHDIIMSDYITKIKSTAPDYVFNEHFKILSGTPRVDLSYFINAVILTTNYLCGSSITKNDILLSSDLSSTDINTSIESLDRTVVSVNQLAFDSEVYHIIENGDIKQFEIFQNEIENGSLYFFQENDISFLRIAFIFYGSICCHHAVLGGIPISDVREFFSAYLAELHEYNEPEQFWALLPKLARILCQRVHDIHSFSHTNLLGKCTSYIDENIYSNVSMSTLEQVTNSSRKTIYKHFKDYLGITPSEYILEKRLEEVKRLLLTTELNILDIATLLNYSSQSHLNKSFKDKYGCTPLKFRKEFKMKGTINVNN